MVKHTQTIRRQKTTNSLSAFDHFMGLALKGLMVTQFTEAIYHESWRKQRDDSFSVYNKFTE